MKCRKCGNNKGQLVTFCEMDSELCPKCQKKFKKEVTDFIKSTMNHPGDCDGCDHPDHKYDHDWE